MPKKNASKNKIEKTTTTVSNSSKNTQQEKSSKKSSDQEKNISTADTAILKSSSRPSKTALRKKESAAEAAITADLKQWQDLHQKWTNSGQKQLVPYNISGQFVAQTPIMHKIFGWGFILSNDYDRLEVLFESGKKVLISNRK